MEREMCPTKFNLTIDDKAPWSIRNEHGELLGHLRPEVWGVALPWAVLHPAVLGALSVVAAVRLREIHRREMQSGHDPVGAGVLGSASDADGGAGSGR